MLKFPKLFFISLIALLYFSATYHGNLATPDSHFYLETAKSIFYNAELVGAESQPLLYWPPLYPLILSVGVPWMNLYINIMHFIGLCSVFLIWQSLARENLYNKQLTYLYSITFCLSTPILMISVFIWSEIIFLMLFSFYIFSLNNYLKNLEPKWLLIGGLFGCLMLLQRNAGIFYVGGVVIGIGYYSKKVTFVNQLFLLAHFILVVSGFLVWNIITLWVENDIPIFNLLLPEVSLKRNFLLNFSEIGKNFLPNVGMVPIQVLVGFILVVGSGVLIVKKHRSNNRMLLFYLVFVIYFLSMGIIPANIDDVSRFMSVCLPIVYLLVFYCLDQFLKYKPQFSKYTYYVFGIWATYPLVRIINNIIYWYERGG